MRRRARHRPESPGIARTCLDLFFALLASRLQKIVASRVGSLLRANKIGLSGNNSEFYRMQGPGTECGHSIGFDTFLLSFETNRVLLFTVSLCLYPPG